MVEHGTMLKAMVQLYLVDGTTLLPLNIRLSLRFELVGVSMQSVKSVRPTELSSVLG